MMRIENAGFSYYGIPAIKNISMEIRKGEIAGIVGPNGSGKTTLLKLMAKIIHPAYGRILLEGTDIKKIPSLRFARKTGFLPSGFEAVFSYSVKEFVSMGRFPYTGRYGSPSERDRQAVNNTMEKLGIKSYAERKIIELSDGEKQLASLAQAVVQEPSLLILDEPTSHLDIGHSFKIMDIIKDLNSGGITVIAVMHDLNLASEYCTNLFMLKEGEVFASGEKKEVLTYQNIEDVYKTKVLVYKNPYTGNPHIFGLPSQLIRESRQNIS